MRRFILFSQPNEEVLKDIEDSLFPSDIMAKTIAYIPSDGSNPQNELYMNDWQKLADKHRAELIPINNALPPSAGEANKVESANIIILTGGNTFVLARNLHQSGIDKAVQKVAQKEDFVIAGFSAGALILGPSIELAGAEPFHENTIQYDNNQGLGLIDFAVFPHYTEEYASFLKKFEKELPYKIKPICDNEYLVYEA